VVKTESGQKKRKMKEGKTWGRGNHLIGHYAGRKKDNPELGGEPKSDLKKGDTMGKDSSINSRAIREKKRMQGAYAYGPRDRERTRTSEKEGKLGLKFWGKRVSEQNVGRCRAGETLLAEKGGADLILRRCAEEGNPSPWPPEKKKRGLGMRSDGEGASQTKKNI